MFIFLSIVHIIACFIMVAFILLQDPKGGGGGALGMMGGGSKSLFGNTGGNQFLVNVTKWVAIIFAFTSIYLAAISAQKTESVMDEYTQDMPQKKENGESTKADTSKADTATGNIKKNNVDTTSKDKKKE